MKHTVTLTTTSLPSMLLTTFTIRTTSQRTACLSQAGQKRADREEIC